MPTTALLDGATEMEVNSRAKQTTRGHSVLASRESASGSVSGSLTGADLEKLSRIWGGAKTALRAAAVLPALRRGKMLTLALLLLAAVGAKAQTTFAAWQNVGTPSTQTIAVTASATGAVSQVEVLTRGANGLEFTKGTGTSSCETPGLTLNAGNTCTESVNFTPAYPGTRLGAVEVLDAGGNVLAAAYLSGVGQGGLDVLTPGNTVTIAGQFRGASDSADGKPATQSYVDQPSGVAFDGAGNMYIADTSNNKVRIVCGGANSATIAHTSCPKTGYMYTLVGTGANNYTGDGGLAALGTLSQPTSVTLDGAGNLYIADTFNNVIREVSAATGLISTFAGNGTQGYAGQDVPANSPTVELDTPRGVTADAWGNIYIADTANQVIRRVDVATGHISTIVGTGVQSGGGLGTFVDNKPANQAGLSQPYAVAFDIHGNMLIPDSGNNRIRVVYADANGNLSTSSQVNTVAGNGLGGDGTCPNGVSTSVALNAPQGVAVDAATNLYIADKGDFCVRKANSTSSTMTTLVKNGTNALGLTGALAPATVFSPIGIAVDGLGNVYVADYGYSIVYEIQSNVAFLDYLPTPVLKGSTSVSSLAAMVENDGNAGPTSISMAALTPANNAELDTTKTTCAEPPSTFGLTQDVDCTIQAYFAPSTTGNPLFGYIYVSGGTVNDNNVNLPLDIILAGDGAQFTITLTASPANSAAFGSPVTFTAQVNASGTTATGSVAFTDSLNGAPATSIGSGTLSGGKATLATSALAVGVHTITASYNGNTTTASIQYTITETTKTTLTASPVSPSTLGAPVTFTATIAGTVGGGQALNGTVVFTDSATTLAGNSIPVTVNGATGTATYTANGLPEGTNVITAQFTPTDATLITGSTGTLTYKVDAPASLTLHSNPATTTYGSPIVFTVGIPTVGSAAATGNVTVKIVPVGSTTPTATLTLPLAGNPAADTYSVASLPVGSYNVTATYAGDNNYGTGSAALGYVQVVTQVQTSTTVVATPNPGNAGNAVAIKATVLQASGSITPTGTVTLTDTFGGNTVTFGGGAQTLIKGTYTYNTSTLAPGTHLITATYSGDTDDASSSSTTSLVINQPSTTTTLTASPAAPIAGKAITLTATVKASAGSASPTGAVTITDAFNGSTVTLGSGAVTLNKGVATLNLASLAAGTHTIKAVYPGDTDDAASSATLTLPVVDATTTTALTATPNPAIVNTTITFTATVKGNGVEPTGTVKFLAGAKDVGSGRLNGSGSVTVTNATLAAGTYQITAVYAGDADNAASTSDPVAEVVGVIPTATALSTASTTGANSQSILVSTVADKGVSGVTPTGTVTFMSGSTKIGSATLNTNGVATLTPALGTGTYSIIANYGGDSLHGPSSSVAVPISGTGSSFSIGINPGTVTMQASQSSTMNVDLTSLGGFADTISLGCVGLPAGITCHFASIDVKLNANGTGTTQLTIDSNNPLGGGTSTSSMNQPAGQSRTAMAGIFLPFSLFFGWVMWSFRKRNARVLSAVVMLMLTGAALLATGCGGGFTQSTAAPGTYTIQIAGVGTNSNVTEYQTVTLTVTK